MLLAYLLIFLGCVIEGELTIIAGVIAIHLGKLSLAPLMLGCLLGGFIGDWFFFELGRHKGEAIQNRWPRLRERLEKVSRFLDKYASAAILLLRFQIAMRSVGNFALGNSNVSRRRYLLLNALASLLWAIIIPLAVLAFVKLMVWTRGTIFPR